MRALWLPGVLRAAGLTVHEVSGWKDRGKDSWGPVRGITCHHTGGSRNSSDEGEIRVLLNGSSSAPPPIAQLYLSRTGEWHVIASGLCYHNKVGWAGPNEGYGNDALLGIEAQHSGGDEPWTSRQYDSYVRGVAALVRHDAPDWNVTVARVAGHKEHQPGSKSDPTFNMSNFRAHVLAEIEEWNMPITDEDAQKIARANWAYKLSSPWLDVEDRPAGDWIKFADAGRRDLAALGQSLHTALAALAALAGDDPVDEQAIVAGVLAGLDAEAIAAAIPDNIADRVVDAIHARTAPRP